MNTGTVIVPSRFCCRAFALGISLPLIESEREGIFPVVHDFSEKRVVFAPVPRSKVPAPTPPLLDAWRRYSGMTCIVAVPGTGPGVGTGAGAGAAGADWNAALSLSGLRGGCCWCHRVPDSALVPALWIELVEVP